MVEIFFGRTISMTTTQTPTPALPTNLTANDPELIVLDDGSRVLLVTANDQSLSGIWAQRYDDQGNAVGQLEQLNTTITASYQSNPEVVALSQTELLVTWIDNGGGGGDLYTQTLTLNPDGSMTPGPETQINTATAANYSKDFEVTVLEDGGYVMVWYEFHATASGRSVYAQHVKADGSTNGPFLAPDPGTVNQTEAEVLALKDTDGDGKAGFVITWSANNGLWGSDATGGIYGQMYDENGVAIGTEFHVNTTTASEQDQSRMVASDDGGFMVLWHHDGSPTEIRFQNFNADGSLDGSEGTLQTTVSLNNIAVNAESWQAISLSDGGLAIAWHDSYGNLYVQSFDFDGNAITAETLIDTNNTIGNGAGFALDLDQLPDGQLIVTWEEDISDDIYTQTIDAPPAVGAVTASSAQESTTQDSEILDKIVADRGSELPRCILPDEENRDIIEPETFVFVSKAVPEQVPGTTEVDEFLTLLDLTSNNEAEIENTEISPQALTVQEMWPTNDKGFSELPSIQVDDIVFN